MLIYLLRHGRAEDGFDKPDDLRELTDDGRERLRRAAPVWRRLADPLDTICASPLVRAQQTAIELRDAVRGKPAIETHSALVPGARIAEALELVTAALAAGRAGVAFVGHEPHLGLLLGTLLTGGPGLALPLKKGMLVGVELPSSASLIGELAFALTQRAAARLS
ncbi:MAG: phosphohistidine phosphatase SixA [Planctomycetes bacterium]|nr:phosphohistidine phosphatase SixA [Planctomycetota bacterium]